MPVSSLVSSVARVAALALVSGTLAMGASSPAVAEPVPFMNTKSFSGSSSWTVPPGVTELDIVVVGGRGLRSAVGTSGGLGLKLAGTMPVTPGQTMQVTVGASGASTGDPGSNGGGPGGAGSLNGRGGGASDIRIGGTGLEDRVLVAGGGGGAAQTGRGGDAGLAGSGQSGQAGLNTTCAHVLSFAQGGSQTAGGKGGNANNNQCYLDRMGDGGAGTDGALGVGGSGNNPSRGLNAGAGGGGGLYGGGGGVSGGGGGGGSSYYDPALFDITTNALTEEDTKVTFTYETSAKSLAVGPGYRALTANGTSYTFLEVSMVDQGDNPIFEPNLTATSSDPGVTFGPVTLMSGYYVISMTAGYRAGPVTATVTAPTLGVSGSVTIDVAKGTRPVVVTSSPPAQSVVGGTYQVTASGGTAQTPVSFTTSSAGCTVADAHDNSALVTFAHIGTCVIDAARGEDPDLLVPVPVSQSIVVGRGAQNALEFASVPNQASVGQTHQATTRGSAPGLPVTFSSLTAGVCSVDAAGVASFLAVGDCVLSAAQAGNADYFPSNTVVQVIAVGPKQVVQVPPAPAPAPARKKVTLTLHGASKGRAADTLKVSGAKAAAGQRVHVLAKNSKGRWKLVKAVRLDRAGRATIKVRDRNGTAVTSYRVQLPATTSFAAATSKVMRLR